MKRLVLGAVVALVASPALAADLPAGYGKVRSYAAAGTVWRPGPPPSTREDDVYVRVVPVYQRRYVETRTYAYQARPRYTK